MLDSGVLYSTFDYGSGGKIIPIYYSSDDCSNAYIIFQWVIPSLDPTVDDLY